MAKWTWWTRNFRFLIFDFRLLRKDVKDVKGRVDGVDGVDLVDRVDEHGRTRTGPDGEFLIFDF